MKAAGITIRNNSNVTSVERQENGKLTVTLDNGEPMVDVDCLLWAIGRKPGSL
jgi:pyruvate/2-oxoglutarate dehydrogenase complex dihydrolipoamide dehydrogenase (E3) component